MKLRTTLANSVYSLTLEDRMCLIIVSCQHFGLYCLFVCWPDIYISECFYMYIPYDTIPHASPPHTNNTTHTHKNKNTTTAKTVAIIIAATKRDLADEPTNTQTTIPTTRATEYAANVGAIFVDTSARTNDNVQLLFRRVAERVLELRELARNNGHQHPHRDGVGGGVVGGGGSSMLMTPTSTRTLEGGVAWVGGGDGGGGNIVGTGGGDISTGRSGGGGETNTNRSLSDNYGEGEQNSPKDTSTLSADELEENMSEEVASSGLCATFGCAASVDKTGESQCIIM